MIQFFMDLIDTFRNKINKQRILIPSDYFLKYRHDYHFRFFTNDKVLYKEIHSFDSKEGVVVKYNPVNNDPNLRLLLKDLNTNKEFFIDPSLAQPILHKTKENRTRKYLSTNNPLFNFHTIIDEEILITPQERPIFPISSRVLSNEALRKKYPVVIYINTTHVISIPDLGFIYIGIHIGSQSLISYTKIYHPNGEIKNLIPLELSQELYLKLLTITEIEL